MLPVKVPVYLYPNSTRPRSRVLEGRKLDKIQINNTFACTGQKATKL